LKKIWVDLNGEELREEKVKTTFPSHVSEIQLIILLTNYRGRQLEITQYEVEDKKALRWCSMEGPEDLESLWGKS